MERIKKMTKKQKTIAAVTVAGIVLAGGVIGGVSSMNSDGDNELATAQEPPEKSALELTFDYKEKLKEEYEVISDGEELSIKTADVTPEIDTSEIGTSNHEVEIDEIVFDLTVVVEDNRKLKLNEFTELTLETEISKDDLETQIIEGLIPELEEGDELDFLFSYPEEFNLKNEGEHEVEVTARYANNHRNSVKQTVMVTVEKPEEEVEEETEVDEVATETESSSESTSSSASSNNSGSTGSTNTASTGGSSNSGSSSEVSGSRDTSSSSSESSNSGSSGSTGGESVSSSEPQNKDNEASSEPTPSKEESKPEESTGPAPTPAPSTPAPSGLPSGATKTGEDSTGVEYSISRGLPNGGNVHTVVVGSSTKRVLLAGIDNAGNHFIAFVSRGSYGYMGDYPTISDEAANMLRELGSQFLSAHGM